MNPITALLQAMGFGVDQGTALAQAMRGENPNARMQSGPILNEDGTFVGPAGTDLRRGMDDPRVGMGNRAVPMPPPRPALSPLTPVADVNAGRVSVAPGPILAQAMQPDTSPDNRDIGGGDRTPMMAPVSDATATTVNPPQRGFLERLMDDSKTGVSPLEYALRGFTAAGTQDPARTMMQFSAQDTENAKIREARRARMVPKIVGQAGPNGAIQLVQMPDGRIVPQTLDQVMQMNKDLKSADFEADVKKALLVEREKDRLRQDQEKRKRDAESSGERVQAGLSVQQLNQIADSLEKTDTATGPIIGLFPKWVRDVVTPEGSSLQDAAERIVQGGLRATLGGQFTQAEGDRFLARAYNPRLDEKQNAANLRTIAREIAAMQLDKDNALKYFQTNGTLEGFTPNAKPQGTPSSPPPSDQLRSAVTAAGIAFEPDKFEYRIGPNGQVQRKAK